MDDLGVLQDIKSYILELEYPLANSMNNEELADIFKASNRCFLISWMLKLMDTYEDVICNKNSMELGQILYENGFCTNEQSIHFMDGTLEASAQCKILQDMFIYIKVIKNPLTEEVKQVSMQEIENFSKNDLNLFPTYGEIKTISNETNDTEKIKKGLENKNFKKSTTEFSDVDISKLIDDIQLEVPCLKTFVDNNSQKNLDDNVLICISPDSDEVLKKCHVYIKQISQFVKDVNTIETFINNKDSILEKDQIRSPINEALIKEICDEICEFLKSQKNLKSN